MKRGWGPYALVGLVSAALLGPALFTDQVLFFRDILHYYAPTRAAADAAWRALSLPMWNEGVHAGVPLLGDPHAAVLYPPNLLSLLLPFPRAYTWGLALHHALGGLGVLVLLRRATGSGWAGAAGALAFMACGHVVGLATAGPLMAGLAYVPWFLVVLAGGAPLPRKVALLALLGALQALSGDPQSVVYSALASLAWALWSPERRAALGALSGGLALAALLAAPQLLPALQTLRLSTRSTPGEDFTHWMLHPARLVELFLPFALGGHLEQPAFWARFAVHGPAPLPFSLSLYLGASTLPLGLLGLRRRLPLARVGLTLLLGGLLLALGAHVGLGGLHAHVPPFRLFRYPEKYVVLASLGWALLVGLGFARALEPAPLPRRRLLGLSAALGLLALLAGALALAPGALRPLGEWAVRAGGVERVAPEAPLLALGHSLRVGLPFALAALAALALLRRRPGAWSARALLWGVLALDLGLAARRVLWFGDGSLFREPSPVAEAVHASAPAQPFRLWRDTLGLRGAVPELHTVAELVAARRWERATLKSNLASLFGIEELSGYGAVQLRREDLLVRALKGQELRLAQLFNACMLLTATHAPSLAANPRVQQVEAWPALHAVLWRLEDCPARLRTARRVRTVASEQEAARALAAPGLDVLGDAVVEGTEGGGEALLTPATLSGQELRAGYAAATAQVPAGGGFLLFASSSHPGWRAQVDGREVPVVHANLAAMGVWLPAGVHRVELRYREPHLPLALALGALGLALTAGLALRGRRRTAQGAAASGVGSAAAADGSTR